MADVQWIDQVEIKSASSSRKYVVSQKVEHGRPTGTYGCSCPGWKGYGRCKHLASMGLTSCRAPGTPAPRGYGRGDNSAFADQAFSHYDPNREGFGNASQWWQAAQHWAGSRERHRYQRPSKPATSHAGDMRLLGLSSMPDDAKGLVRAMRKMALKTHPDHGGSAEAFREMYAAFERLQRHY